MAKLLSEVTLFESAPNVDAGSGVIRGAKLIGLTSKNGRRYEHAALSRAVGLYEGKKVYVDHPRPDESGDRRFNDWAGVLSNCEARADGIYGDVTLRRESSHFRGIIEAATNPRFFKECGFSHVADGESRMVGDTEIVESIRDVFSVDLVTDPATTKGFYESANRNMNTLTLKQAIESLPQSNSFRSRLVEGMEAGLFDGGEVLGGEAKSGDPLAMIYNALNKVLDALTKVVASKDSASAAAQKGQQQNQEQSSQQGQNMQSQNQGGSGDQDGNADQGQRTQQTNANQVAGGGDATKNRIESLERRLALADAKNTLVESGIEATDIRIKKLAETTDATDRKSLIESWPKKTAASQSGDGYWPESSPPASGSGDFADPDYEKRFWESAKK